MNQRIPKDLDWSDYEADGQRMNDELDLSPDPTAIQFAQAILDQDLFDEEIDTTPVRGNDVKAEFWADYGNYTYIIEVRRQIQDDFQRSEGHAAGEQNHP